MNARLAPTIALVALAGLACGPVTAPDAARPADASDESAQDVPAADARVVPPPVAADACGFAGDPTGATDSTTALRDAIQCAIDHGYTPVIVPAGTFALSARVDVPTRVALVGERRGSFGVNGPQDYDALPMLRFASGLAGDGLVLADGASLTGLQLTAPGQTGATSAVVRIAGAAVAVRNVKITAGIWGLRADDGVDARDGSVSNVFMVAPQSGMYIGHATRGLRVENVHVWNNATAAAGSAGFVFGTCAGLEASLLSAFNYELAMGLRSTPDADIVGFEGDFCRDGLAVSGSTHANISGASIFSHFSSVLIDDTASVTVVGSHLASNAVATTWLRGAGASLTMTGTTTVRSSDSWNAPAVRVDGGHTLVLAGNTFDVHGIGIQFTGAPDRGMVYGNSITVAGAGNTAWAPSGVGHTGFEANSTNAPP